MDCFSRVKYTYAKLSHRNSERLHHHLLVHITTCTYYCCFTKYCSCIYKVWHSNRPLKGQKRQHQPWITFRFNCSNYYKSLRLRAISLCCGNLEYFFLKWTLSLHVILVFHKFGLQIQTKSFLRHFRHIKVLLVQHIPLSVSCNK